MSSVSVLFTRTDDLTSALLRWFTRSRASHVGVAFELDGVPVVVHAYGVGGVQISRRKVFLAKRIPVGEFVVEESVSLRALIETVGDRYDYESILLFVPIIIGRWFGRKWKKPWVSSDAIVCSELVAKLPIEAFRGLDPELATPQDLLVRCESRLSRV